MNTEEKKIEKICSFYVSDYHLEMIMIPYINRKIEEKSNIEIISERKLKDTVKDVIKNINLTKQRKKEMLNLNWNNSSTKKIKIRENSKEQVIFVVGSTSYIEKINEEIEEKNNLSKTKIINCYNIEDIKQNITEIATKHTKVLNTKEEKEIA
ncbi:MAG: hypothetical protein IKF97_00050 [Clostridia bacterium]|nr:hypothetical protein [Clostridia bacterium]